MDAKGWQEGLAHGGGERVKWTYFDALCLFAAIVLLMLWLERGVGAQIPGGLKLCAVLLGVISLIGADDD